MSNESIDLRTPEIPWPRLGDVVFQESPDWRNNARLDFAKDRWEIYAAGYKRAADILVARALETQHELDFLVYPIVFLYRHYLELRLKELIVAGRELLDLPPDLCQVHRLDVLWISCRKILEEVWPEGSSADLDAVESCINEVSRTDPQSVSFRYPIVKDGKRTLPGMTRVCIVNLRDVMERISALLEGSSMGISAYLDDKRSIDNFYR